MIALSNICDTKQRQQDAEKMEGDIKARMNNKFDEASERQRRE